jgi:hypothetical protein
VERVPKTAPQNGRFLPPFSQVPRLWLFIVFPNFSHNKPVQRASQLSVTSNIGG